MYRIQTHYPTVTDPIPVFSEPGFFFNEEAQLRLQDSGSFHLLTALNTRTQQADARCAVFVDNQLAISPKLAPFGSIEFIFTLPDVALSNLIDTLEQEVVRLSLPALRITNYPHCYAPHQAERLVRELKQRHYHLADRLLNYHIDVTPNPLPARMHHSEQRRLAKCHKAQFTAAVWSNPDVSEVIDFVVRSRRQQGYQLTIAPDRLAHLLETNPDNYPVLIVRDGPTIAALTVAVRVRHDILYNFLPASNQAYHAYSPAVLLTEGLYTYCQQQGITLLDLGVSVDEHRKPKPSLMQFKRNLGAVESPKMVWEKRF